MKCPICSGIVKTMYKPETQYHCRGDCGLIIRVCNIEFESKLIEIVGRLTLEPTSDLLERV